MGIVCISDLICTILIGAFLLKNSSEVYQCSKDLFGVGLGFFLYQFFFFFRNFLTIICCYFTNKPDDKAMLTRLTFTFCDWIGLSAYVIWATVIMSRPLTDECKSSNNGVNSWWLGCMVLLVFAWIYVSCICCICNIVCPLLTLLLIFLIKSGSHHAR